MCASETTRDGFRWTHRVTFFNGLLFVAYCYYTSSLFTSLSYDEFKYAGWCLDAVVFMSCSRQVSFKWYGNNVGKLGLHQFKLKKTSRESMRVGRGWIGKNFRSTSFHVGNLRRIVVLYELKGNNVSSHYYFLGCCFVKCSRHRNESCRLRAQNCVGRTPSWLHRELQTVVFTSVFHRDELIETYTCFCP